MAFIDILKNYNILSKIDKAREFVARKLPYIIGGGAALIAAPTGPAGMALAGFGGTGVGRIIQGAIAPEYVEKNINVGGEEIPEPWSTLARASEVGTLMYPLGLLTQALSPTPTTPTIANLVEKSQPSTTPQYTESQSRQILDSAVEAANQAKTTPQVALKALNLSPTDRWNLYLQASQPQFQQYEGQYGFGRPWHQVALEQLAAEAQKKGFWSEDYQIMAKNIINSIADPAYREGMKQTFRRFIPNL